ncbi:MAG TPA: hypothetical protein VMH81_33465 [Bryobacteraceae bacterium]|nr:hypothetical protein [Bryobacteraceae bacterium]
MSLEDQRGEVQRILCAPQFRKAPKLRRFLQLICDLQFQGRSGEINEYLIATEAFDKGPDFNPAEDSLVRVQARELRRRLHEYYQNEGKSSRFILDVPPGAYQPVFTSAATEGETPPKTRPAALRAAWLILAGTVLACAALLVAADHERRLLIRSTAMAANVGHSSPTPSIAGLWSRFFDSEVPTLLVVSSPEVDECGDRKTGVDGCTEEEYTGMGEAVAIHLITSLFRSSRQTVLVKPSRIVTADDVKRYNLVLLGGKSVNMWTRRLGEGLSLSEPNQPPGFETVLDKRSGRVTRDRAIVALRHHPDTGRWALFLWGHHSQGTHAAAEAATDELLLAHLNWPSAPFPDNFHVLVSVDIHDGIPERPIPLALRIP